MGYRDVPIATERCLGCGAEVPQGTEVCPSCRSPIDVGRFAELELKLKPNLRRARIFLGVVAAISALHVLIALAMDSPVIGSAVSLAFFGACFAVAFKRPLGASITAMAMFLLNEAAALGMGRLLFVFQGLILKIVLVSLLASAIRSGYRARDLRGQWRKRDRNIGIAVLAGSVVLGFAFGVMSSR